MKISTRGQYALEALLNLATGTLEKPHSIHSIAEETKLSEGYLEQLFIPLKKAGFITGSRGVQGGYRLAKKPGEISAYDILNKMETSLRSVPCQNGGECPRKKACESKEVWDKVSGALEATLKTVSLEDLATIYRGVHGVFIG